MEHVELISKMGVVGLIPVYNDSNIDTAKNVLEASYRAGVRVFEFTNRGENALEVFVELAKSVKYYPDLNLGIGTIFSAMDAGAFIDAGADFIVSPALIPEVAHFCNSKAKLWIPGCGTVTEIYQALQLGAQVIKAFPGNVLGTGFVKSVKAVYPHVPIMPTGGVRPTEENLSNWIHVGAHCVGMGSQLFEKQLISDGRFDLLTEKVRQVISTIEGIRRHNG